MQVRHIYGALNLEFEDGHYVNFSIMDVECDRCMEGDCTYCERAEKPWNEYYELLKCGYGYSKVSYERDKTEALKALVRMLQSYLDAKGETKECTDMAR